MKSQRETMREKITQHPNNLGSMSLCDDIILIPCGGIHLQITLSSSSQMFVEFYDRYFPSPCLLLSPMAFCIKSFQHYNATFAVGC